VTEISPRDSRRVWAIARELFTPKSWKVPECIEDLRVSQPLLRELRLTEGRELLLTDFGLSAFRETVRLLDELDPTEGLAAYSDMWSACRRVLEQCLSNGQVPERDQEYIELILTEVNSRIATYSYVVPMFGVELDGLNEISLGTLRVVRPSKALIDGLGLQYAADHLELMIEQTKQYLWLTGSVRGTSDTSKERFIERCRLVCGLLAVQAASIYQMGSYGFRIGIITTPEEGHGRALSLSWKESHRELYIASKFVGSQRFSIDSELCTEISESTMGHRAIEVLESQSRTPLEEAWVRALFWYSDAHRDQTLVMRFLKLWSCAEAFFSAGHTDISESVSFGLAAIVVYGDFRSAEPPEFQGLKKKLKTMYGQRSRATHRASYSHVSDRDVADLSQWIAWMLLGIVALGCRGVRTPAEAVEFLRRRAVVGPRPAVKKAIDVVRRALARLDQWLKRIA